MTVEEMTAPQSPQSPPPPSQSPPPPSQSPPPHPKEDIVMNDDEKEEEELTGGGGGGKRFVWSLPPATLASEETFPCDLCPADLTSESSLKAHQIQLHVNPFYLSDEDKQHVLGYRVSEDKSWRDEAPVFPTGLFRCHLCFRLWSDRVELRVHLEAHAKKRTEDFEEVEQRPTQQEKGGKEKVNKVSRR
jgi:hypothetical protein